MLRYVCCILFVSLVYFEVEAQNLSEKAIYPPYCGPVCLIACPHGNVLDKRGCPTCKCKPGPIKPCRKLYCPTLYCTHGFATDSYGCEICKCKPDPILPPVIKKCPVNSRANIRCYPAITQNSCSSDADCRGGKICCLSGCNKTCVRPKRI